jgi:hypothetical protein
VPALGTTGGRVSPDSCGKNAAHVSRNNLTDEAWTTAQRELRVARISVCTRAAVQRRAAHRSRVIQRSATCRSRFGFLVLGLYPAPLVPWILPPFHLLRCARTSALCPRTRTNSTPPTSTTGFYRLLHSQLSPWGGQFPTTHLVLRADCNTRSCHSRVRRAAHPALVTVLVAHSRVLPLQGKARPTAGPRLSDKFLWTRLRRRKSWGIPKYPHFHRLSAVVAMPTRRASPVLLSLLVILGRLTTNLKVVRSSRSQRSCRYHVGCKDDPRPRSAPARYRRCTLIERNRTAPPSRLMTTVLSH